MSPALLTGRVSLRLGNTRNQFAFDVGDPQFALRNGGIKRLCTDLCSHVLMSCLSWKWRKRSSVKITERTYEEGTEAFHPRRKSSHSEAASCGQSTRLGAV